MVEIKNPMAAKEPVRSLSGNRAVAPDRWPHRPRTCTLCVLPICGAGTDPVCNRPKSIPEVTP